ncbi:uncharacterized protein HMPREF1541_09436 [Cyphellophora europaea CBS 101466]|uniref:Uncharacterized protein n=1 Tax=Cyphellophora europaea (strain CBS 101466) TaxID=1220924 RepID=W2SCE6_CYPE1|nr:uncharacterized protein HMPREF1541_09436 [Cyphellophora europaea CBS 101466]ETN45604.1 hypothetical protein HMPREF1541_09436 [Cyphellophora europaea CBS 101466]
MASVKVLKGEQLLAWELAKKQGTAGTLRQQLGARRGEPAPTPSSLSTPPAWFDPARATVGRAAKVYPEASLLGAPEDVRLLIYNFMELDAKDTASDLSTTPTTTYDSLLLVSRQFYHELDTAYWQHWLVRQNKIKAFLNMPFFKEGVEFCSKTGKVSLVSKSLVLRSFKSLSLEVPLDLHPKLLGALKVAIQTLPLTELKLLFTGKDAYGTETNLGSCGLQQEKSSRQLPVSGQRFAYRAEFINTLMKLRNLDTLVLSNANVPVTFNQVINNKPNLTKLSIIPDKRTSLSYEWESAARNAYDPTLRHAAFGAAIPLDVKNLPPLLELEISANAMVWSSSVVKHSLVTVEKLSWIVPKPSHQAGPVPGSNLNWLRQTKDLLHLAAMRADRVKLKSLRICIEPTIYDNALSHLRYDRHEVGELIASLKADVKDITSLRNFELHMDYLSDFAHNGFDFVTSLGDNLERYYISDKLIVTDNEKIPSAYVPHNEELTAHNEFLTEDTDHLAVGTQTLSVHHYLVRHLTIDNFGVLSFSPFHLKDSNHAPPGEEDATRTDRILNRKNLVFLAYQYTDKRNNLLRVVEAADGASTPPAKDLEVYDEDRVRLLRLNGRLLDRERNKHMYAVGYKPPTAANEVAVGIDQRPARRYPVVIRHDSHDHWMCKS